MSKFPQRFGDYLLLERLSYGGMAEIFRAKAFGVEGFQKTFALKRILPSVSSDAKFVNMFIDEAKIASSLEHGNICQIFQFGRVGGFYFQLMEYIAGLDLSRLAIHFKKAGLELPLNIVLYMVARACEGLDHAHNKSDPWGNPLHIVHRDVSAQNIMVSFEGVVKLIDFGIAKAKSRISRTESGIIKGRLSYLAPEIIRREPFDRRGDIFALGVVLYELLTGHRPFWRKTDFEIIHALLNETVPPPSSINSAIPPFIDEVVLKCLASLPDERYQTAEELLVDLDRCLIENGEPTNTNRIREFLSRHFTEKIEEERRKEEEFADIYMVDEALNAVDANDMVTFGRPLSSGQITTAFELTAKTSLPGSSPNATPVVTLPDGHDTLSDADRFDSDVLRQLPARPLEVAPQPPASGPQPSSRPHAGPTDQHEALDATRGAQPPWDPSQIPDETEEPERLGSHELFDEATVFDGGPPSSVRKDWETLSGSETTDTEPRAIPRLPAAAPPGTERPKHGPLGTHSEEVSFGDLYHELFGDLSEETIQEGPAGPAAPARPPRKE